MSPVSVLNDSGGGEERPPGGFDSEGAVQRIIKVDGGARGGGAR